MTINEKNNIYDIFEKQKNNGILDFSNLLKILPAKYRKNSNIKKNNTEWRIRFYLINKEYKIDISYQKNNEERIFVNLKNEDINEQNVKLDALDSLRQYLVYECYFDS